MRCAQMLAGALWVLGSAGTLHADEVLFANGDRWTGRLISLVDGVLTFETELVGKLEVKASRIQSFQTDQPIEVHLRDGSVVVGAAAPSEARSFQTQGLAETQPRSLSLEETVAINPPAPEAPRWRGSALAGIELERGNSIKDSAHADLKARHVTDTRRLQLRTTYEGERTTDSKGTSTTNDREIAGSIRYDRALGERLFWYARTKGEKDGPAGLKLGIEAGGGLGYRFRKRKDFDLSARVGLLWIRRDFEKGEDDDSPAGELGWDLTRELNQVFSAFQHGTFTQSLTKADISLFELESGLRAKTTDRSFVEAKLVYEWNSETASDADRQDVDYILGVGYEF